MITQDIDPRLAEVSAAARERQSAARNVRRSMLRAIDAGVSQREIAKVLGVSQPAVSQMLSASRAREALTRGPVGRKLVEHRAEVLDIAKKHKASHVRIFGSVASGDDKADSDIDLLVQMPHDSGMFDVARLGESLADLLGVPVDVVPEHMVRHDALPAIKEAAVVL